MVLKYKKINSVYRQSIKLWYVMISVKIYTCYKKNLKSKWFLNLTLSDNYISLHVYKKIKWLYKKIKINTKHQK